MKQRKPALFRGRHFDPEIIVTCVRWYLRFSLSLRHVEELMAERGLIVDHTTVWRWCQKYGPIIYQRLKGKVKCKTTTWHINETYVRVAGRWLYLFRAVDNHGDTVDFIYRKHVIVKRPRRFWRGLYPTRTIALRIF